MAGALFVILRTSGTDNPEAALGPTASPAPSVSPVPSSTDGLAVTLRLAAWDSPNNQWETDDLSTGSADAGRTVPFLLLIENAAAGQTYNVRLTYQCRVGGMEGFAFLTDFDSDSGDVPALAAPGPQRAFPDTAVVIPDDPSIKGDDEGGAGLLRLWGATVESLPAGPAPASTCETNKTFFIRVRALRETAHVLWGAKLPEAGGSGGRFEIKATIEGAKQEPEVIGVVVSG